MCGGKNYTNARCSETIGRKLLFRLKKIISELIEI